MTGNTPRETPGRLHAERLMRTVPPARLRVLRMLAERFGYWPHVDWTRLDDPTPPPPLSCDQCGAPLRWSQEQCCACWLIDGLSNAEWRRFMAVQSAVRDLIVERRPREMRVGEHMQKNPQGRRCSRCGEIEKRAGQDCEAVVCWRCTTFLADLERRRYWTREVRSKLRECPECGRWAVEKGRRYCRSCAAKKLRESNR